MGGRLILLQVFVISLAVAESDEHTATPHFCGSRVCRTWERRAAWRTLTHRARDGRSYLTNELTVNVLLRSPL